LNAPTDAKTVGMHWLQGDRRRHHELYLEPNHVSTAGVHANLRSIHDAVEVIS